jgi:hypothetical protein
MTPRAGLRLACLAGFLGIALGAAGVAIDQMWSLPPTGASAYEIAAFVAQNRTALLAAMALTTVGVTLWLVFGVGVWLWLREGPGGEGLLSTVFLVGLVGFVTLLLAGFGSFFLLVYRGSEASDPRLLYDLAFGLLAISGVPTALALGSYAALVLGHPALPRWTAYVAIVAAVAHMSLLASLVVRSGFFSLEGGVTIAIPATLFAWILCVGLAILSGTRSPR